MCIHRHQGFGATRQEIVAYIGAFVKGLRLELKQFFAKDPADFIILDPRFERWATVRLELQAVRGDDVGSGDVVQAIHCVQRASLGYDAILGAGENGGENGTGGSATPTEVCDAGCDVA